MIHVIGLGIGDISVLSDDSKQTIRTCDVLIGSIRQRELLAKLIHINTKIYDYPSPIEQLSPLIKHHQNKKLVILASGDPLFFGIGAWLRRHVAPSELLFSPNISSIQAAFSYLKQPWQDVEIISLHGRPLISIRPHLRNQHWYAILTDKNSQPHHIAQELQQYSFELSNLWVCESLGAADEKIRQFTVAELINSTVTFHPLHITIINTQGKAGILPEFPGISDTLFETGCSSGKGMITKKQVRLAALNLLQTQRKDVCWDLGAGCGGMSVEWAYWHLQSDIYAIEDHKERLNYLKINQEKFGVVKNLKIIAGTIPYDVLDGLPRPDKIFIGGSRDQLLQTLTLCWEKYLNPTGCIVISCVTESSKYIAMKFIEEKQLHSTVEKIEINTSKAETLANKELMRPQLSVQLIKITKPECHES